MSVIAKFRAYLFIFGLVWFISFLLQILNFHSMAFLVVRPLIAGLIASSLVAGLTFVLKSFLPEMYNALFAPTSIPPKAPEPTNNAEAKGQKLNVTLGDDDDAGDSFSSKSGDSGFGRLPDPSASRMMSSGYETKAPSASEKMVFEQEPKVMAKAVRSVMNKE